MTSLRMRVTILLVASIVGVVGLATLAVVSVVRGPAPEATVEPLARQISLLAQLVPHVVSGETGADIDLRDRPADGEKDERATHVLNQALRSNGGTLSAVVARAENRPGIVASVQLPSRRWLILDIPDFSPPRDRWFVLSGWITLIVLGATGVALYFAAVLTRPVAMLERAVARVGPDGILAPLSEEGSGDVRATARALNRLSKRLKSAMESRMRLVAAAGHDLRTPMTRMRLRAEFLPDEEREKWLKDIDELDRIADSAIKLVREEIDEDTLEPVALSVVVHEVAEELISLGLKVETGRVDEIFVSAGGLGMRRALRNLVVNAATHGKGCRVDLIAEGKKAIITIADHGPGIPTHLLDKAFEPFFRVDPGRRQSVPGAGLGLAIAKEIIERNGGSITLTNAAGGGLLQTIEFDIA
ncbi:two-component sensor histidine kinase [Sinorhizobium meliloti]|uniref:ATP-binding protein n=1 Tax=Rhizobium meliloti TaxID=382 RepID=UPI003F17AF4E